MTVASLTLPTAQVRYDAPVEAELERLVKLFALQPTLSSTYPLRWLAVQIFEGDEGLLAEVIAVGGSSLAAEVTASMQRLEARYGEDLDITLVDQRYRFVHTLVGKVLTRPGSVHDLTVSDRIDKILTHRFLGIPIFLFIMWVVFKLTTDVAGPFVDWVDGVISGPISNWMIALLGLVGLGGTWVESLLIGAVLVGVGGVLVFVPVLFTLYFALAILEDSGYMARAAFVMDRMMHRLGLHGKSFLPMIVGFGCTVPAIYATRTLDSPRDRLMTGLLVPFMSCSARLPVYVLVATIFFPAHAGLVIFGLYLTGVAMAIGVGFLLRSTVFRNQPPSPFVLELPPYRIPTWRCIWGQMWERTSSFVRNAWTLILATSVLIWVLLAIPVRGEGQFAQAEIDQSAFALVAGGISPIFAPLGFGSWESSGALISGFVAKEVVVSTMLQTFHIDEGEAEEAVPTTFMEDVSGIFTSLGTALLDAIKVLPQMVGISLGAAEEEAPPDGLGMAIQASFATSSGGHPALAALAFLVFVLLYTPCMVATAAARHEFGTRWMWVSIVGQFVVAWLAALIVFQGGRLLGLG
ncbi:ferrous iron transport protein B [Candidatus Oscillochloris fontis]|uniref:ferrous iron transport protein B n=1 Tax=Candidatus Oscillochloris fontis TaxID=2496868 RepID=UPI00101BC137|nr:ferrous iron transport protein B [Candidatus Oscillochloris fontis]